MSFQERIARPHRNADTVDVRLIGEELGPDLSARTKAMLDSPVFQEPIVHAFLEQTLRKIWQAFENPGSSKAEGTGKNPVTRHQLQVRVAHTLDQAMREFEESGQSPEMTTRMSRVCQQIQNSFSEAVMKGARSERTMARSK